MNYVESNLRKGEQVIAEAKISFLWLIPAIVWAVILIAIGIVFYISPDILLGKSMSAQDIEKSGQVLVIILIFFVASGALVFFARFLQMVTTHLVVTDKRVIGKVGVFSVKTMDIPIEKVDNCAYDAKFLGNLFKYYTVTLKSASGNYTYKGIHNAALFKNKTIDAIDSRQEYLRKAQAMEIANAMNAKNAQ